jgi:hypothetical protein
MKGMSVAGALLVLCSCDSEPQHESNSAIIHNQIGRFSALPGQNGYPPMVLDTVTGCLVTVEKNSDGKYDLMDIQATCRLQSQVPIVDTISRAGK